MPQCLFRNCFRLFYVWSGVLFTNDFSVTYVAAQLKLGAAPWYYRVSAVWGGHEGFPAVLWRSILAAWTPGGSRLSSAILPEMKCSSRVLAVMGMIKCRFPAVHADDSNPFDRQLPFYRQTGNDLNPLLQRISVSSCIHRCSYMG